MIKIFHKERMKLFVRNNHVLPTVRVSSGLAFIDLSCSYILLFNSSYALASFREGDRYKEKDRDVARIKVREL